MTIDKVFEEWLVSEFRDYYDYDSTYEIEVDSYEITYLIFSEDFSGGFLPTKIDPDNAVRLSPSHFKNVRISATMRIDCESDDDDFRNARIEDFVRYGAEKGLWSGKYKLYYLTGENCETIRAMLEKIFAERGFVDKDLYFACEYMMLAMKEVVYTTSVIHKRIYEALKVIGGRSNRVLSLAILNTVVRCYFENHSENEIVL
ncbi:MAG: hypothetical protein LUH08_02520 [Ruminococcus sp.]|nr:hypothetical protein [Ruminococcus sp.]